MATIYLAALGRRGIQEVASQNAQKAHYAAARISGLRGFDLRFSAPFFNEFVVKTTSETGKVLDALLKKKVIGGLALKTDYPEIADSMLVCVTETARKEAIDDLVLALSEA